MEETATAEQESGLERNIAKLLRNGASFLLGGLGTIDEDVTEAVKAVYGRPQETIKTKRGEWQIYTRFGDSIAPFFESERREQRNNFLAVYYRKGKARTLFLGEHDAEQEIETAAREISDRVLEQRRWFAWPPRKLTQDDGTMYALGKLGGLYFSSLFIEYGISFLTSYKPTYTRFLEYCNSKGIDEGIAIQIIMLSTLVGLTSLSGMAKVGTILGRLADNYRQRNLPLSYKYGEEAVKQIKEEHKAGKYNLALTAAYESFKRETRKDPGKVAFAGIYGIFRRDCVLGLNIENISAAERLLENNGNLTAADMLKIMKMT